MEIFTETLKKLWNFWEIRSLVVLSLSLQVILIVFGSRRKIVNPQSWIQILVKVIIWCAYISADWVATVALSVLASNVADGEHESFKASDSLQAFWAPFLLLHLGGPDTITAYSLEDNELWLRHLLGLIVQVGVAFYIMLRFWSSNELTFLSIPVFIAGIIKYGERTWVLWSSSTQRFTDSIGLFPVGIRDFFYFERNHQTLAAYHFAESVDKNLVQAYFSYFRLRNLFADKPISGEARRYNYSIISNKSAEDAFELVATQLGLMYDVLYTKADIIHSRFGNYLRCISFICSVSALALFSIVTDKHSYLLIDIMVTYLLLVSAVILEIYAFIVLLSSDWTKLRFIKFRVASYKETTETLAETLVKITSCLQSCLISKKRWSASIGQYNLMSSVRKERQRTFLGFEKLSCTRKLLEKYQYLTWANVDIGLQEAIFNYLKTIADELHQDERNSLFFRQSRDEHLSRRGEYALKDYRFCDLLVAEEYEAIIIIWHMVTDECYQTDVKHVQDNVDNVDNNCRISKWLSDYMMYLLLFCPFMLPKGIGQIRYEHTYIHLVEGLTYDALLDFYPHSVLENARKLASQLKDDESCWNKRWDVIREVWLEMLAYAAHHFEWKEHAQQLRRGGELLTHVSVLMINFRLNKQVM